MTTRSSLPDAVWLVTGASRGAGRTLAEMALRHGHHVVATTSRLGDLQPLVEGHGAAVMAIELDANDESADLDAVERTIGTFGRLDVVVNNAGYDTPENDVDPRGTYERIQTNLFAALWISEAALSYMYPPYAGHIFQVFGIDSIARCLDRRLYEASKRALEGFSEHLARETAPYAIDVSILVPTDVHGEWLTDGRAHSYALEAF